MARKLKPNEALRKYLWNHLDSIILSETCPKVINLERDFAKFLKSQYGLPAIIADEKTSEWLVLLKRRVNDYIDLWGNFGVNLPISMHPDSEEILVTWKNENFEELLGYPALNFEYMRVFDWIRALNGKEFLLVVALCLLETGASKVFITDGSGDGGVDLIAHINSGPFSATCIFVQAKTLASNQLSRDTVFLEYGKYSGLLSSKISEKYFEIVERKKSHQGMSLVYQIYVNNYVMKNAKEVASELGVSLRSIRSIAHTLSQKAELATLKKCLEANRDNLSRNLERNMVQHLDLLAYSE